MEDAEILKKIPFFSYVLLKMPGPGSKLG